MLTPSSLACFEAIIDTSGVAERIEPLLPSGGRHRQLPARTLLVGVLLAIADGRPAHLTRIHQALVGLPERDRQRLGVSVTSRRGTHLLTYRQTERTFSLMIATMDPTPVPSFAGIDHHQRPQHLSAARAHIDRSARQANLDGFCDHLVEASVPEVYKTATAAVAVDWTDHPSWARGAIEPDILAADPDASWGHRNPNTPGTRNELFFGYYAQAVTMVPEEHGPPVPELARRVNLDAPNIDPPTAMTVTLQHMVNDGVSIGDVLADSGYAHRVTDRWAGPLRQLGAQLIQDLHPHDRGPKGTHQGAICANGNLYCPATPPDLLTLNPLPATATVELTVRHDQQTAEAAHYKLGRLTADDGDGYHRVACPAAAGKLRCPLKTTSMTLPYNRPEILTPPSGHPPPCCTQTSITVPPTVNAKTRQKHDYPSQTFRRSYRRRTGAERTFSTLKDPATIDTRRGWSRLFGRTKNLVLLACATVVRNTTITAAFERRQADNAKRTSNGKPPKTRKRRRQKPPTPPNHNTAHDPQHDPD